MSKQTCYLRKTEITLADEKTYVFRALALSRKTMPIISTLLDDSASDAAKLDALVSAVEKSLSYDQDAETVAHLLDDGLVPLVEDEGDLHSRVMDALMAGMGGKKK